MRTLVTPESIKDWSMTSPKEKLIKVCVKAANHGLSFAFQRAEGTIYRTWFADILLLMAELRPRPIT
jgi:hypothetical protein